MITINNTLQEILKDIYKHKKNAVYYKGRNIYLRSGRNYGEYCSDFIEQNALELYHLGKLPKVVEKIVEARNPKTKMFRKQISLDVKSKWPVASKKGIIKTASKKKLNKDYDYEKVIKNIYDYELGKKPSKNKRYDFVPLKERRDYGVGGYDTLERKALDLIEEGKLPKELREQLKTRIKRSFKQLKNI